MKLLCLFTLAALLGGTLDSGEKELSARTERDFEKSVLVLSGASSIEELDEDELERYRRYVAHPLCINLSSRSRLLSSGLLTSYRVATLLDYRQRFGDVLSLTELATVDAYGAAFVEALAPFISLESASLPGQRMDNSHHLEHDAVTRSSARWARSDGGDEWNWSSAAKYDIGIDRRWEAGLAGKIAGKVSVKATGKSTGSLSRKNYGVSDMNGSFHLSYEGLRYLSRVVVGAYNCRFGQGLAFWSGFSLSSTAKASSASRNPTMLSPYRGYDCSSSLKGAAAEFSFPCGNLSSLELTAFVSHPGLAGANLSWFSRNGQIGTTFYLSCIAAENGLSKVGPPDLSKAAETGLSKVGETSDGGRKALQVNASKLSIDARWNIKGVDLFCEAAGDLINRTAAALLGTRGSVGNFKMAAVMMYYPQSYDPSFTGAMRSFSKCTDTHALMLMTDWMGRGRRHSGSVSLNCSHKPSNGLQMKTELLWNWQINPSISLETKASWRWRDYESDAHRAELRNILRYKNDGWNLAFRDDFLWSHSAAGLLCADLGYDFPRLVRLWSRVGAFHADNWSDRIYCYEKDVPGMFNVPAMYGRGFWCSSLVGLRLPCGLKIYLRLGVTHKTLQRETVTRAECRFQLNYSI